MTRLVERSMIERCPGCAVIRFDCRGWRTIACQTATVSHLLDRRTEAQGARSRACRQASIGHRDLPTMRIAPAAPRRRGPLGTSEARPLDLDAGHRPAPLCRRTWSRMNLAKLDDACVEIDEVDVPADSGPCAGMAVRAGGVVRPPSAVLPCGRGQWAAEDSFERCERDACLVRLDTRQVVGERRVRTALGRVRAGRG